MASGFDIFPWFKNFVVNPVTDWERFINPQFNVTINQGDAAVENRVLARAGSYGKQLGRVQEVLDILVARLPPPPLSSMEERSIDKYKETRKQVVSAVKEAKQDDGNGTSTAEFDRWLDALAALRDTDPERFEDYADRLQDVVARNPRCHERRPRKLTARVAVPCVPRLPPPVGENPRAAAPNHATARSPFAMRTSSRSNPHRERIRFQSCRLCSPNPASGSRIARASAM